MFDFLFGKPQTTTTQKVVGDISPELKPYAEEILKEAQDIFTKRKEEGYQPYEGKTIAEFDPDELAAFEKLKGLVGVQTPYLEDYEAALGEYGGSLDEYRKAIEGIETDMTAEGLKEYMSPYQQAVVDVQKRKAQEDFAQRIMPEFEKQAISAGGMSGLGSRAGVQAALLGTGQAQTLADIQAKGSQKAYEDAVRQFQYSQAAARQQAGDILGAEQARLGAAEERRGLGLQKLNVGLTEAGLLTDIGQQRRQRAQALLDEAYAREMEKREFLPTELAKYQGFVYGSPFTQALSKTQTTSTPRTPIGQQLLSAGLTGLNIYGQSTGKNPFSIFGFKNGGKIDKGLSSLPVVKRQTPGSVRSGFASPLIKTLQQRLGSGDIQREIQGRMAAQQQGRTSTLARMMASNEARKKQQQESNLLRKALMDKYRKERKPTMTTGEMLAKPLAAASEAALKAKNVGLVGALGAAGAAGMSVYADVRSDLDKEQRKYLDAMFKQDMLDQERKEAQAEKNQQKLDEINQKKIDFKREEAEAKANLSKEKFNEAQKVRSAMVEAEKAGAAIEKTKAETKKLKAQAKSEGKMTGEKITTQMNAVGKQAERLLGTALAGNVSVGPDGSIRVKQSFYSGKSKGFQNKINNAITRANEEALREIGKKDPNIIAADLSEKIRKILQLDSEVKTNSKNPKSNKTTNRAQGARATPDGFIQVK